MTTHYDVLGVRPDATADLIKRAYYRKARAYHPDAHAGSAHPVLAEAERAMAALNAAWQVLRDPLLRSEYDAALVSAELAAAAGRPGRRGSRARLRPSAPALEIGHGFRYWMGTLHAPGSDGHHRLSLSIDGATDLTPLRALAPDGLWALHAQGAAIGDAQLVHLQGMSGLQWLDLSATRVTDAGLVHLSGLDALETLSLWDTPVTDAGLALIGRLGSLRVLGLGNTAVTDGGLAHLSDLSGLRILQLWGTEVAGHGLQHLHGLADLDIVSLPWKVRGRHRRRLKAALPGALVA